MPSALRYIRTQIPTIGGSYSVNVADNYSAYIFYGSGTMAGNYSVAASGAPTYPMFVEIYYNGNFTLGNNNISFFGKQLTQEQAINPCKIEALYDLGAAAWIVNVLDNSKANPGAYESVAVRTLATGGATLSLTAKDKQWQHLTGSGTLSGNHSITTSGDFPDGYTFFIKYACTFAPAGNTVTIFGNAISNDQISYGNTLVIAYYDAANLAWRTHVIQGFTSEFPRKEVIVVPVSFESGEQCNNRIYIPYAFQLDQIKSCVTNDLSATNAGTITVSIDGTPVTTGVVTIPLSSPLDTENSATPTALNTGSAGSYIDLLTAKGNAGGKAVVTLFLTRLI